MRIFDSPCHVTSLSMLYIALVRSNLTYDSQVWAASSSGSIYLMKTLGGMQGRALRLIFHYLTLSYKTRLIHLNLLPLSFFYEYLDLLFPFCCPQFCYSVFCHGSSGLDLHLFHARTYTFRNSYSVGICPLWNGLTIEI